MAACRSIQHIFEKPLPENPTLLESLSSSSWKPIEQPSFTEIFGELHFKENITVSQSPSSTFKVFNNPQISSFKLFGNRTIDENDISSLLPSKNHLNSESLKLCTEGLGSESSDDVEDMKNEMNQQNWESKENNKAITTTMPMPMAMTTTTTTAISKISTMENHGELKRSRGGCVGSAFPPPISCIGKGGKPWVCFKSYREDGRFVLKQVKIRTQELLHACREDGRLRLQFVQPNDDEVSEDDEFDEDEEEEEEEEELLSDDIDED